MRIGTRRSALAMAQARQVQAALAAHGVQSDLATFTTVGDERLDTPLSAIGAKGLFTRELERALSDGEIDCAVHSLKDLPTEMPEGLAVVAVLERADPRDVLIIHQRVHAGSLQDLPDDARIGTSSLRRRAQLLAQRPDLEVVELRGNVETRLKKVDGRHVHAAILAAAGLGRLGLASWISCPLDPPEWLPAAGQGAIAIQARTPDPGVVRILAALNHVPTAHAVIAERAFLAALEGGCQIPIGALAMNGTLHGLVADRDGAHVLRGSQPMDRTQPAAAGVALAAALREQGATELLHALRM